MNQICYFSGTRFDAKNQLHKQEYKNDLKKVIVKENDEFNQRFIIIE